MVVRRQFWCLRCGEVALVAIAVVVLIGLSTRQGSSVETKSAVTTSDDFAAKIVPFVTTYCSDCHAGKKPEGDLDLSKFKDASAVASNRKTWRKVLGKLAAHEMPPADEDQPTDEERKAVVQWVDAELARPVPLSQQDPGRVTIHRLNRAEYNNTIRDLVGVDFHPADDFPADDVGYGFDNIGDVLSTSPLLLEKYMRAAERIMQQAIVVPKPNAVAPTKSFDVAKLDATVAAELTFRALGGWPKMASCGRSGTRLSKATIGCASEPAAENPATTCRTWSSKWTTKRSRRSTSRPIGCRRVMSASPT